MGWTVVPDALHDLLVRLKREYGDFPIAITENGSAYDDPIPTNGLVEDPERLSRTSATTSRPSRARRRPASTCRATSLVAGC